MIRMFDKPANIFRILAGILLFQFVGGCNYNINNNYTITFDSQGGGVSSITKTEGTSITLPYTNRNDHIFNGWFNSVSGGIKYDSPYTITCDVTMYAQWTDIGPNGSDNYGDNMTINGIECVLVKNGTFTMGSPVGENYRQGDERQHQVTLTQDYWISKYPIIDAQYNNGNGTDHPVVNVTWIQADDWARNKGGRLPTEAEWEFAARGGNKGEGYIYSGSNNLDGAGWYRDNSGGQTHPVGEKRPNELGIYDMSGNVWEWCGDWYGSYPANTITNPTGHSTGGTDGRVRRGGSWNSLASSCRVAYRNYDHPSANSDFTGFRVVFPRN